MGPAKKIDALLDDPQLRFRKMIISFKEPVLEKVRLLGNRIKHKGVPDSEQRKREPKLDQHRKFILKELGINE